MKLTFLERQKLDSELIDIDVLFRKELRSRDPQEKVFIKLNRKRSLINKKILNDNQIRRF